MTWDGDGVDPWLPDRLSQEARVTAAERRLYDSWLASMSRWLVKAKRGVYAGGARPDPTGVFSAAPDWAREMDRFVDGPVKDTMGIAYRDLFGDGYRFDTRPAVTAHLADVHTRMVRTTDDVFALVAGEVAHGANAGESIPDIAARVDEVLSVTGTERWQGRAVTVARTECLTGDAVIESDGIRAAYRRWYEGPVLRVHMASGNQFTGTPNHPVLTPGGWLALGLLEPGHQLVRHGGGQGVRAAGDVHIGDVPATFREVYDALSAVGVTLRTKAGQPDFHGDGTNGYVDVATTDRRLARDIEAAGREHVGDLTFKPARVRLASLHGLGEPFPVGGLTRPAHDAQWSKAPLDSVRRQPGVTRQVRDASSGGVLGGKARYVDLNPARAVLPKIVVLSPLGGAHVPHRYAVVAEDPFDGALVGAVPFGDRLLAVAGDVCGNDRGLIQIGPVDLPSKHCATGPQRHPGVGQYGPDPLGVDAVLLLEGGQGSAGPVGVDDVVRVERFSYSGHVYNLFTRRGWFGVGPYYSANTIGALNAGRHDSFEAVAEELDVPMERVWLSTIDSRTRPAHAAADGQRVPLRQPFTVGGAQLMFPGDPTGPAAQVINCRCGELLVEEGEDVDLTSRQHTADDWDAWHDAQAAAPPTDTPPADPPPRDLETEARQRQAAIDAARRSGGAAAELDEIITTGASAQAIEHRIAAQVARGALPPDVADEMRAALAAGDLDGVRAAGWRHASTRGAVRVGDAGDVVPYDPKLHEAIDDVRRGQQAIIIRPGTRWVDEDRLLDKAAVESATPEDIARAAAARLPSANAPPLGDLLDNVMAGRDRSGSIDKATFGQWMEGDFAGLRVTVTRADVDWRFGGVRVQGSISNADGKSVGRFSRAFGRDEEGRLYVAHELLKIQRQYQGSGFQAQFNGNLIDWYRRSGAAYVKVGANIDVGGYTWARSGYDFATVYDALDLFSRLNNRLSEIAGLPLRQVRWLDDARTKPAYVWDGPAVFDAKPAWTQAQLRKAFKGASDEEIARQLRIGQEFINDLAERTFGDDLPPAYELSQLGRWPGASRDDVWIGKHIMLGSHWAGVLWL